VSAVIFPVLAGAAPIGFPSAIDVSQTFFQSTSAILPVAEKSAEMVLSVCPIFRVFIPVAGRDSLPAASVTISNAVPRCTNRSAEGIV
jgi:hypothetical protein